MNIFTNYTTIFLCLLLTSHIASAESSVTVRPQIGYGYINSDNSGGIAHVGIRALLNASEIRRYGLELSKLSMDGGKDFTSFGIVLEQRLWGWFNMSIGTVGYFDYGENSENPVGLITNLGWEPSHYKTFKPFITFRNDVIFSNDVDTVQSFSIGMSLEF
ncbi:hypothetical protein MNBD_GAMMA18-2431 [hydrothermal vent metagenome]|uniref:Outer membrane protein beta-barrel domain-containing protein n=1 Tax=hydrothermal vent metagenome TaxID=652676 RepID=A0A3B0YSV8_9ZZZZ